MRRLALAALLLAASALAVTGAQAADTHLKQRSEIDAKYKWRLEDIYPTNEAWDAAFKREAELIPKLAAYKGKLATSGATLLACLKDQDEVGELSNKLFVYASMRRDEDNRVPIYQGQVDRITSQNSRLGEALAYFNPEMLAIPNAKLEAFYKSTPGLRLYRHHLDDLLRTRAHVLSEKEEKLLAAAGDFSGSAGAIFTAFNNADLRYGTIKDETGKSIELTKGGFGRALQSPDRRFRRDAFRAFNSAYGKFNNTLGAVMNANVKSDEFYARSRKYDSAVAASLDGPNIPVSVYRNLVSTVNAHLESLHRYAALRKKWMKLDTLRVYDLYAPLVPEARIDVPYETARQNVLNGLAPLGDEYLSAFRKGLDSGWIDVYETEGKTSGAYNWGSYTTHPYVLLNWSNTLEDEFTLAHEMGHAMHSYFANGNQPYVYGNYATFVAEVASTTNEATLVNYLLKQNLTKAQRLYLLNYLLEQIRTTMFRQTLFAEFELKTHELAEKGEPLTAEAMNAAYQELMQRYYGPDLVLDPEEQFEWSRVPHFYNSFYVYQYATSYCAATALSKKILTEGTPAVTRYLSFLKSGNSDYPIEVLKKAGVDMNSPAPVEAAIARFDEVLGEMEKLHDTP
ncbi:MAG TPA: oligoendopeptidase F [Candidatus Saccharimonadaceae bacterium]|jgi:oligoendopeptidase F|nr:oligoendopeptidase F [Candidatus Saccharimonadaceae bacterium]